MTDSQPTGSRVAHVAVGQVEAAVERLCLDGGTSPARARQLRWIAKELRLVSAHPDFEPGGPVRAAAAARDVGTVLDTGARVGELCALRVDDLDLSGAQPVLTVVRRPQARAAAEPVTERILLSPGTHVALRQWLATREEIIDSLQLGVKALWVSVAGNHAGLPAADGHSIRRPAGMPLRPRGLQRAYTRAVAELNSELAGSAGWRPLPYRLEQLRRAVEVRPSRLVG